MGLLRNVATDIKTGAKNVDNKMGQAYDEEKINSKIRDLEKKIEDDKKKMGDKIYEAYLKGEKFETDKCCEGIKSKYDEIDALKKEKEELAAKAKAERDANRKAAEEEKSKN